MATGLNLDDKVEIMATKQAFIMKPWRTTRNSLCEHPYMYDGDEVCELVAVYILNIIAKKYNKDDIGLYRDGGLAVQKDIINIFYDDGLKILIQYFQYYTNQNFVQIFRFSQSFFYIHLIFGN